MKKVALFVLVGLLVGTVGFAAEGNQSQRIYNAFIEQYPGALEHYTKEQLMRFVNHPKTQERMLNAIQSGKQANATDAQKEKRRRELFKALDEQGLSKDEIRDLKMIRKEKMLEKKKAHVENLREKHPDATAKEIKHKVHEKRLERKSSDKDQK